MAKNLNKNDSDLKIKKNIIMKNNKSSNHQADIKNANKGGKGTNKTYDKNQGNKGKQLNPNQKKSKN